MTDQQADKKDTVVDIDPSQPSGDRRESPSHIFGEMRHSPEQIKDLFRNGTYPYKTKIRKSSYEKHKEELQVELLKVQNWVKQTGQRSSLFSRAAMRPARVARSSASWSI